MTLQGQVNNLTTILADNVAVAVPGNLDYSIANAYSTVHDLLLKKSSGAFDRFGVNRSPAPITSRSI